MKKKMSPQTRQLAGTTIFSLVCLSVWLAATLKYGSQPSSPDLILCQYLINLNNRKCQVWQHLSKFIDKVSTQKFSSITGTWAAPT